MHGRGSRGHRPGSSMAGSASQKQAVRLQAPLFGELSTAQLTLSSALALVGLRFARQRAHAQGAQVNRRLQLGSDNRPR